MVDLVTLLCMLELSSYCYGAVNCPLLLLGSLLSVAHNGVHYNFGIESSYLQLSPHAHTRHTLILDTSALHLGAG